MVNADADTLLFYQTLLWHHRFFAVVAWKVNCVENGRHVHCLVLRKNSFQLAVEAGIPVVLTFQQPVLASASDPEGKFPVFVFWC